MPDRYDPTALHHAVALSDALEAIKSMPDRLRTCWMVCSIIADAMTDEHNGSDVAGPLMEAAWNASANAAALERAEPEEYALALECAADRRDEWETERRGDL